MNLWFLITPAVLWLGRRFPLVSRKWPKNLAIHLGFAPAVAFFQLGVESSIIPALGLFPGLMTSFPVTLANLMIIGFHQSIVTYWMVIGIQCGLGWYNRSQEQQKEALRLELRSSELQGQLSQAHLSALKMQLQPHFCSIRSMQSWCWSDSRKGPKRKRC